MRLLGEGFHTLIKGCFVLLGTSHYIYQQSDFFFGGSIIRIPKLNVRMSGTQVLNLDFES